MSRRSPTLGLPVPPIDGLAAWADELPSISVVIPTYNRRELLEKTLEACRRCAGGVELEFVVIDDGSEDDTRIALEKLATEMPNLVWRSIENGGPGQARNLGASLAQGDVVLFLGDDIVPRNSDFFRVHAELHARRPEGDLAVVGKAVWPDHAGADVSFVMAHVQGRGGEQFGFADLIPFSFLDWRFFYTANASIRRDVVDDWRTEGFDSSFSLAAYEDAEFLFRMMRRREMPVRLLYAPGSVGTHHHPFSVQTFMTRQTHCGMMAKVFTDLHDDPEVRDSIGLGGIHHALTRPVHPGDEAGIADSLSVIEGLKSWARLIESRMNLGSHAWHDDLLGAIFGLCYLHGYVMAWSAPGANHARAYDFLLAEFARRMGRSIHVELSDRAMAHMESMTRLFDLPPDGGWRARSRLWQWARRRPALYALYLRLRRFR